MKFLVAYKRFREYTLTSNARERSRQEGRLVEEIEVVGNSQWALSNSYILADLAWRLSFATSSDNRVRKNRTPSPTWLWSRSTSLPSRAVTPGRSSCQCGSIVDHLGIRVTNVPFSFALLLAVPPLLLLVHCQYSPRFRNTASTVDAWHPVVRLGFISIRGSNKFIHPTLFKLKTDMINVNDDGNLHARQGQRN